MVSLSQLSRGLTMQDQLIRDTEGAELLGASVSTFWRRVSDGTIPRPIKIGGMSRWKRSEIQDVIDRADKARNTK